MPPLARQAGPVTIVVPPFWTGASALVAALVAVTSLCGLFLEETYARETASWAAQAAGQDAANLLVAALLLAAVVFVRRGSLRAYLAWLGLLLYLVYAFAIYAFAVRFQFLFPIYVAVLGLSFYTLAGGLLAASPARLGLALRRNRWSSAAALFLLVVGALFGLLWLAEIVPAAVSGVPPASLGENSLLTNPVHVLDLAFLLPGMVATAYLLRRGAFAGRLAASPLLIFAVAMGLGILFGFGFSAARSLPVPLPAAVLVTAIVVTGAVLATLFLREVETGG